MNINRTTTLRQATSIVVVVAVAFTPYAAAQKILAEGVQDLANQIAANVAEEQKHKIAVLPFRELDGRTTVLGTYISEELVTRLFMIKSGLEIVERTMLDKVLGELKLEETGLIDPATAKEVGKVVGVDAVVTGTITDLQSFVAINCRLIDVQTGSIFGAAQARIAKDDDVRKILGSPMPRTTLSGTQSSGDTGSPRVTYENIFQSRLFRLEVVSVDTAPEHITLVIEIEPTTDEPVDFFLKRTETMVLDQEANTWGGGVSRVEDTLGVFGGVELIPGTKVRSRVRLKAKDQSSSMVPAARVPFTFVSVESHSRQRIVIEGLEPR